jgi:hypothetical protein
MRRPSAGREASASPSAGCARWTASASPPARGRCWRSSAERRGQDHAVQHRLRPLPRRPGRVRWTGRT